MTIHHLQQGLLDNLNLVTIVCDAAGRLVFKVLDTEGRIARTLVTFVQEGKQEIELPLSDLQSGRYILNAFSGDVFQKSISFTKS